MELKANSSYIIIFNIPSFNRTFMELKAVMYNEFHHDNRCFNRTFMELKAYCFS